MTSARSVISGRVLAKAFGHERLGRYAAPRAACYRSQELLAAKRNSLHDAHHEAMECLGQMLWESQRSGKPPDGNAYAFAAQG